MFRNISISKPLTSYLFKAISQIKQNQTTKIKKPSIGNSKVSHLSTILNLQIIAMFAIFPFKYHHQKLRIKNRVSRVNQNRKKVKIENQNLQIGIEECPKYIVKRWGLEPTGSEINNTTLLFLLILLAYKSITFLIVLHKILSQVSYLKGSVSLIQSFNRVTCSACLKYELIYEGRLIRI